MTDNTNEDKRSYDFFPEIPMSEPPVNELVTEGHANYKRLEGRLDKKTGISLFLGVVGLCVAGSYFYTSKINDGYKASVAEAIQHEKDYASIGGSNMIIDHISKLRSAINPESEAEYFSADEFKNRVTTVSEMLVAGNAKGLYQVPGVSIDGLKHGVQGKELLITPSFDVIYDPENPAVKSIGGKLGYTISGIVTYDREYTVEQKGEGGEIETITKFKSVTEPKVVALRLDDGRLYEITSIDPDLGGKTEALSGPEIFDNFADAKNIQVFGHGLLEDDIQKMVSSQFVSIGNSLIPDLAKGIYPPETIKKGVGGILVYMQDNNGAIYPKLTHKMSSFSEFKREGFADTKSRDYSVTKFIKLDLGGETKLLMLTVARLENGRAAPVAGLITKEGNSYSYENIDFGGENSNWVQLEGYPTVKVSDLSRELIAISGIKELTINNK